MTDAERLSATMAEVTLLLFDLIGMEHDGVVYAPTINLDRLPFAAVRAAKTACDFLMVGVGVLDEAIAGNEPPEIPFDDELRALLGGE